jgi:membrane-bound metal-dependent hydrolase YbcI (DUF457 family)
MIDFDPFSLRYMPHRAFLYSFASGASAATMFFIEGSQWMTAAVAFFGFGMLAAHCINGILRARATAIKDGTT